LTVAERVPKGRQVVGLIGNSGETVDQDQEVAQ
jgi:uncharacterized protein GlcG (DUF336 family)